MSKKESQNKKIIAYLEDGNAITPIEALTLFGCMRLASRIADLKKKGYPITSTIISTGEARYAQYKLEEPLPMAVGNDSEGERFEDIFPSDDITDIF